MLTVREWSVRSRGENPPQNRGTFRVICAICQAVANVVAPAQGPLGRLRWWPVRAVKAHPGAVSVPAGLHQTPSLEGAASAGRVTVQDTKRTQPDMAAAQAPGTRPHRRGRGTPGQDGPAGWGQSGAGQRKRKCWRQRPTAAVSLPPPVAYSPRAREPHSAHRAA